MRAYIDESGNTGTNLFDPAQPYFLNVAMSSPVDFDDVFRERVKRIVHTAGIEYLHASEMGAHGVEAIARSVIELVEFSQSRFYFAYVNKPDVAAMKFFDAIFDLGENPAAPHHIYILHPARLEVSTAPEIRCNLRFEGYEALLEGNDKRPIPGIRK